MAKRTMQLRALLLVLAVVLSACGSTLQEDGSLPAQAQGDGLVVADALGDTSGGTTTLGGGGATGTAATPGRTGAGGTSTSGSSTTGASVPSTSGDPTSTDGTAGTAGGTAGDSAGSTTGTSTGPRPTGEATGEPIKVGVVVADAAALYAVFSVESDYDPYALYEAFRSYFNDNGGFGGRPLEFYYEVIDVAEDYNAAGQRVCERFTQDNKMDVIFGGGAAVMLECFEQHDMAVFGPARWTQDDHPTTHPNFFSLDGIRVDRYAGSYIDMAVAAGFIGPGDKLGVLYEDCPWGQRVYNNVSAPTAKRHGIEIVEATIKCIENLVADLGPVTNGARAAALRFQSQLATHVMVLSGAEGFIAGQFSRAAEEQRYRPNYIVTSNSWAYNNSNPETQVGWHVNQRPQVAGFGWVPMQDVGDAADPNVEGQAQAQARCREVDPGMGGADQYEEGTQDRIQYELNFYNICDSWFGTRAAIEASSLNFSFRALRDTWPQALAPLESAIMAGGRYKVEASGYDAVGHVRQFTFDPNRGRFSYTGNLVTIP